MRGRDLQPREGGSFQGIHPDVIVSAWRVEQRRELMRKEVEAMFGRMRVHRHNHQYLVDLRVRIFRVETGQEHISWKKYQALKVAAEEEERFWMKLFADLNGVAYERQLAIHRKHAAIERIEVMLKRHLELNPGDKEMDPLIAALRSAKSNNRDVPPEMLGEFRKKFDYLYVDGPKPPAEPLGLFKRFFRS